MLFRKELRRAWGGPYCFLMTSQFLSIFLSKELLALQEPMQTLNL
jgi:hypothetical protein